MLGFDPGPADGIMGPRTRLATIAFQKACHLIADGIPGKVTQEALRLVLAREAPPDAPVPRSQVAGLPISVGRITRAIHTVVIHCTATPAGRELSRVSLKAMHKSRGFSDIGYHAFMHLDGSWEIGRPWNTIGAHVAGYNTGTLGLSYVGGLEGERAADTRTPAQRQSLDEFLQATLEAIPTIRAIKGHRDFSPDADRDGLVEPHEWIKMCPCYDAEDEHRALTQRRTTQ
jgi:N-acetylmuramoyl-L-alanine amidase